MDSVQLRAIWRIPANIGFVGKYAKSAPSLTRTNL